MTNPLTNQHGKVCKGRRRVRNKASYVESKQDGDFAPNFETMLEADNDLIWGIDIN